VLDVDSPSLCRPPDVDDVVREEEYEGRMESRKYRRSCRSPYLVKVEYEVGSSISNKLRLAVIWYHLQ